MHDARDIGKIREIAKLNCLSAYHAGFITEDGKKRVVIKPKGLEYAGETLAVR